MNTKKLLSLDIQKNEEEAHVEICGVVPSKEIEEMKNETLTHIAKHKKVDGFREGEVPLDVVEREVGALELWKQSASEVVMKNIPDVLVEEKLTPLDRPHIHITSIALGADVKFTLHFSLLPEVKLPNLDTIEVKEPEKAEEATEEEVSAVLLDLRRAKYKKAHPEKEAPKEEKDLPELDDQFISEISKESKNIDEFKISVKENITKEKIMQRKNNFRSAILDAIIDGTTVVIPKSVIEEEAKRGRMEVQAHAETLQTTVEDFLEKQNITEETFMEDLRKDAEKRSKAQLVLNTISIKEKIQVDLKVLEKELERFSNKQHGMTEEQLRTYLNAILSNEAVIEFLEKKYSK